MCDSKQELKQCSESLPTLDLIGLMFKWQYLKRIKLDQVALFLEDCNILSVESVKQAKNKCLRNSIYLKPKEQNGFSFWLAGFKINYRIFWVWRMIYDRLLHTWGHWNAPKVIYLSSFKFVRQLCLLLLLSITTCSAN